MALVDTKRHTVEHVQHSYRCDYCQRTAAWRCAACGRDVCGDHFEMDMYGWRWPGFEDTICHSDDYCKECARVGEPFRKQQAEARAAFLATWHRLRREWHAAAVEAAR